MTIINRKRDLLELELSDYVLKAEKYRKLSHKLGQTVTATATLSQTVFTREF